MLVFTIIMTIAAVIGVWYAYLEHREKKRQEKSGPKPDTSLLDPQPIHERLITFFWEYPEKGGSHASWCYRARYLSGFRSRYYSVMGVRKGQGEIEAGRGFRRGSAPDPGIF